MNRATDCQLGDAEAIQDCECTNQSWPPTSWWTTTYPLSLTMPDEVPNASTSGCQLDAPTV